jgi:uncharacterized protein (DUF58 family)
MRPSPHFLHTLDRLQMRVRHATASTGIGERRSRSKGVGMEFADYRGYIQGDDTRHLDAHLHARLGDFYIRQYEVLKQLPVTILIDGSRSMQQGEPEKLDVARWLSGCLGYLALSGGDLVQLSFWSGRNLSFSPRFQGVRRADRLFVWAEDAAPDGREPFDAALAEFASHLPRSGLAILISDFWVENPAGALRTIAASGTELWAVQALMPGELDPALLSQGETRLIDAESGEEILIALDKGVLADYRQALEQWQHELAQAIREIEGEHVLVRTDDDLEKLVLALRARGLFT